MQDVKKNDPQVEYPKIVCSCDHGVVLYNPMAPGKKPAYSSGHLSLMPYTARNVRCVSM